MSKELQKEKLEIPCKFLPVITDYESEEEKQINLELAKEKVEARFKFQDISTRRGNSKQSKTLTQK